MSTQEVVVICGYNAAGKSTIVKEYADKGYARINRDELGGSLDGLVEHVKVYFPMGKSVVLDNTYASVESRAKLIAACQKAGVPIRCVLMSTTIEEAQYNACARMVQKFGHLLSPEEIKKSSDPNTFPCAALFNYRKMYQKPTTTEGFASVESFQFVRQYDPSFTGKAIVLDFDGTLRDTKDGSKYPCDPSNIKILPKRTDILKEWQKKGYILVGVSNQSGIAKGDLTADVAAACFKETNRLLGLDIDVTWCPHKVPPISCWCRKPMPGLGVAHIYKYKLDPRQCIMVGDMGTDKTFAARSGFKFVEADEFFR